MGQKNLEGVGGIKVRERRDIWNRLTPSASSVPEDRWLLGYALTVASWSPDPSPGFTSGGSSCRGPSQAH